jgi:hypothetical protein
MAQVKLLKDVMEGGSPKIGKRKNAAGKKVFFLFTEGEVVSLSDASAQKYIEAGLAEAFVPEVAVAADGE